MTTLNDYRAGRAHVADLADKAADAVNAANVALAEFDAARTARDGANTIEGGATVEQLRDVNYDLRFNTRIGHLTSAVSDLKARIASMRLPA